MGYSKFKLRDVKQTFGLRFIEDQSLFYDVKKVEASDFLQQSLKKFVQLALAINTEKSRSEWIIAPILAEVKEQLSNQISLFSGTRLDVAPEQGLDGFCDYIISLSSEQYYLSTPILTIVEAKKENIVEGLGQCLATMYAARLFNEKEQQIVPYIYGAVATGTNWKFLKLDQQCAYIDIDEYTFKELPILLGILLHIVGANENTKIQKA